MSTNLNMHSTPFVVPFNLIDDINSDPSSLSGSDTYTKKLFHLFRSVKSGYCPSLKLLHISVSVRTAFPSLPCRMAASLLYSWAIQNASNGKSLRSFWMSSTPSDTI